RDDGAHGKLVSIVSAACGLGPAAQSLLDRGFVSLDPHSRLPRLFFTEPGLAALRAMMRDRRLADPEKFAHIRVELGIDPPTEAKGAE
ncbi:MAG: hypothetical protein JO122_12900, partial [Acetobacteraceae bacterium]|nr:hypothetical protein [Acetobacteraceae bacterium]